jgi:hypothetical protein
VTGEEVCETPAELACLAALRDLAGAQSAPMERHCVRVYEIARELAQRRALEVDRELLLCAALLHDAGLYPGAATADSYVSDGRRLAARVLEPFAWPAPRLERCGDAIERHHELRSQWQRGAEVELLRRADLVDVSVGLVRFGIERRWYRDLVARVPRDGLLGQLVRQVAQMARERPRTLPRIFVTRA